MFHSRIFICLHRCVVRMFFCPSVQHPLKSLSWYSGERLTRSCAVTRAVRCVWESLLVDSAGLLQRVIIDHFLGQVLWTC